MKPRKHLWIGILGLGLAALVPARAEAQVRLQYVVKFVCGSNDGDVSRVVPGSYATSVNIYNPNLTEVTFNKNLALTFPPEEQAAGPVSDIIVDALAPSSALQVDCGEIPSGFSFTGGAPNSPYTEGFLVIESPARLNVTAVYTATTPSGGASVDVEDVVGSKVRAKSNGSQMTICHRPPGNPANAHTLIVGSPAWPAHEAHGDTVGACSP